ncbi:MAG TPA: hypothetical protein QGG93_02020 [Verrucomicrobiota bacterium]|nr:hypothetical protein [Verrucomicrobiota bacterium]
MVRINKVAALLEGVEAGLHDPRFAGIRCFNERKFHEAYDVANLLRLAKRWGKLHRPSAPSVIFWPRGNRPSWISPACELNPFRLAPRWCRGPSCPAIAWLPV